MPSIHISKPTTPAERRELEELMKRTRGVTLYEDLRGRVVYEMPWHPTTPRRVERE